MHTIMALGCRAIRLLNWFGDWLPQLALRVILAWEFWEAGVMKFKGENWFSADMFPFPFSLLSADMNWNMAMWGELIGAVLLLFGLFTRFASISLIIVTIIAIVSVHWSSDWTTFSELLQGYSISNNGFGNYKLPLLYLIMFLPLLFRGGGKFSLDHLLMTRCGSHCHK